jgi:hypothetical protein
MLLKCDWRLGAILFISFNVLLTMVGHPSAFRIRGRSRWHEPLQAFRKAAGQGSYPSWVIAKTFPVSKIHSVLAATGRASLRERDLPAHVNALIIQGTRRSSTCGRILARA